MSSLLPLLLAATLAASPEVQERPLTRWLVRCDAPGATASPLPALDPVGVEAAIHGTGPVPDGWSVQTLPASLPSRRCWFAHRLAPSDAAVGLWLGQARVAWTAYVDGALLWSWGSETGRYAETLTQLSSQANALSTGLTFEAQPLSTPAVASVSH